MSRNVLSQLTLFTNLSIINWGDNHLLKLLLYYVTIFKLLHFILQGNCEMFDYCVSQLTPEQQLALKEALSGSK